MGVSSTLVLTILAINNISMKISKTQDIRQEVNDFRNSMNSITNDKILCNLFFKDIPLNPMNSVEAINSIPSGGSISPSMEFPEAGTSLLQVGTPISRSLQISSISWSNVAYLLTGKLYYYQNGKVTFPVSVTLNIDLKIRDDVNAKLFGSSSFSVSIPNLNFSTSFDLLSDEVTRIIQCNSNSSLNSSIVFNTGWGNLNDPQCTSYNTSPMDPNIHCPQGQYPVSMTYSDITSIQRLKVKSYVCCGVSNF